ncbi:hypothetical protein L2E82_08302 [Cichorium intybus]|uniref:Uncharacterized protein n=1 Tax=Cichorium intybus TaxID=13427 RepID=A0ACB9G641_CICIN|nr:hypothetical protein L2E82_08302 [Cichorium intybus]
MESIPSTNRRPTSESEVGDFPFMDYNSTCLSNNKNTEISENHIQHQESFRKLFFKIMMVSKNFGVHFTQQPEVLEHWELNSWLWDVGSGKILVDPIW